MTMHSRLLLNECSGLHWASSEEWLPLGWGLRLKGLSLSWELTCPQSPSVRAEKVSRMVITSGLEGGERGRDSCLLPLAKLEPRPLPTQWLKKFGWHFHLKFPSGIIVIHEQDELFQRVLKDSIYMVREVPFSPYHFQQFGKTVSSTGSSIKSDVNCHILGRSTSTEVASALKI